MAMYKNHIALDIAAENCCTVDTLVVADIVAPFHKVVDYHHKIDIVVPFDTAAGKVVDN